MTASATLSSDSLNHPRVIRITNRAKDQLITIKRRTGIPTWNIICRWALALSLQEQTPPPKTDESGDSNVEMTWDVFSGANPDVWHAVSVQRFLELPGNHKSLSVFIKAHIHRGIQMMSAQGQFQGIEELIAS